MKTPTNISFDFDPETDDSAAFYSREFWGRRIVIIPKENFELSETTTTFVLTLKSPHLL